MDYKDSPAQQAHRDEEADVKQRRSAPTKVNTYRDLVVWQKGLGLCRVLYQLTQAPSFPTEEKYGLVAQIRRAAVSVPSNIAEGQARQGRKEFARFLYVARGSLAELDTQCILSRDLGYISSKQCEPVLDP